jgi:hypothetical protein
MIPVETVPVIRGGGMRDRRRVGNSRMLYLIHFKNLCKCYNVPIPSITIIKQVIHMVCKFQEWSKK